VVQRKKNGSAPRHSSKGKTENSLLELIRC
jgi:preprotein translocase subunit Sss1